MKNRTKRFEVRLTDEQYATIREKAAKANLTPTEYVRRKVFSGEVGVMDSLAFLKEYSRYLHEIRKIGNNINQVAHYANILQNKGIYSKDVIDEMTIQLRELTAVEMRMEELNIKILKV